MDSDACPAPLQVAASDGFGPYEAFVDKALGLPAGPDQIAVLRIAPSFTPSRVLSVVRRSDGTYVLRSTRLTTNVWGQMMEEMRALQGGQSFSIDEQSQTEALARIVTSKVVNEHKIPPSTATLIANVWRSLRARAQVTEEIGIATGKSDGTFYELWQQGVGVGTHSPAEGTVLGDVVLATEHLESVVNSTSIDSAAELDVARDLLKSALERTNRKEPCLRRYTSH